MSYFKQIKEISRKWWTEASNLIFFYCKSFAKRQFIKDFSWFDLDNLDLPIKNHILKQKPITTKYLIRYNFEKSVEKERCINQVGEIYFGSLSLLLKQNAKSDSESKKLIKMISNRNKTIQSIMRNPIKLLKGWSIESKEV